MISLFIEPMDVWLFRDGRPFDAGLQHRAESMFPPFCSVIAGAIRSYQLARLGISLDNSRAENRQKIRDMVGTSDELKGLQIAGPVVAKRDQMTGQITRFYPQPADAVSVDQKSHALRPASQPRARPEGLITSRTKNFQEEYLLGLDEIPIKGESGLWLSEKNLMSYLQGDTVIGTSGDELFHRETRPGIGLQKQSKTTQMGMLFEVEFVRPQSGVGLWVGIEGETYQDWPEKGVLQLGGESRAAAFERLDLAGTNTDANHSSFPVLQTHPRLRVFFVTPSRFSNGWQPAGGVDRWNRFFKNPVVLRSAALNRSISIGGYDMAGDTHKPNRRYVPAGSVYYFESTTDAPVVLNQPAMSEFHQAFGLGMVLTGRW